MTRSLKLERNEGTTGGSEAIPVVKLHQLLWIFNHGTHHTRVVVEVVAYNSRNCMKIALVDRGKPGLRLCHVRLFNTVRGESTPGDVSGAPFRCEFMRFMLLLLLLWLSRGERSDVSGLFYHRRPLRPRTVA